MAGGLDAGKYFCAFRPGGKCFSLDIPFYRTSEHNIGVVRLIVNPHVLCCFLRWSLTEVPSLHRHYPASAVLRTSPPPHTAWPVSHEMPVGYDRTTARVSRVAAGPFCLHAVAITPAGLMNPIRSYCFHQRRPSPITRWVGSCINRFGRVEDWRASVGRSLCSLFLALSVMRVSQHLDLATYPAPATSNAACGFPRTALSCSFLATGYETGTGQVAFGTKYRTL
jgi:hypothetical protein